VTESVPVVKQPAFVIEPEVLPRASYAMARNRQATVRSVTVRNLGSEPGSPLTIKVSSRWSSAERPPLAEQEFVVECPERGVPIELATGSCRLDDSALVDLEEAAPATVVVSVSDEEGHSVEVEREILVLARNQWNRDLPALTAAFVQPNHPSVADVLSAASTLLLASTGDAALQGYQQKGSTRPIQIAGAIFDSLKSRVPTYIDPPASFEEEGQKLRPLDQVLEQRQGTCIDLACAYAACLEQAGLNPVVVLVHGHAFTCFFTVDEEEGGRLPKEVIEDSTTILNLVDSNLLIGVETVCIPGPDTFADATRAAKRHLTDRAMGCSGCETLMVAGAPPFIEPHLIAAVDVRQCHVNGIRPLPARVIRDGIVTIVIDNGPSELPVTERRDARTNRLLPNTLPARIQQWKNALLDLTMRPGGLLNFDALSRGVGLEPPKGTLGAIEDHLIEGGRIEILGDNRLDPIQVEAGFRTVRDLAEEMLAERWARTHSLYGVVDRTTTLENRVKRLMTRAKLELQETGVNNLNLALGSVVAMINDPRKRNPSAPVFLVPIKIEWNRGRTSPVMILDPSAMTTVNYSLLESLRARYPLELDWFRQDMRDDSGLDILTGLERLREEIIDAGLSGQLDVLDDAAIGILRFSKIRLWKDLNDHWETFLTSPVVRHLVDGANGSFQDDADPEGHGAPSFDDTTLLNPQPADGAQTKAVVRALSGQSFVLEGPPGTGKSQTITNLLANALAAGRKVLFVAEKEAARDVVKERLQAVGLDPFCLDLHDKGSTTEQIKSQLSDALDFAPSAQMERWEQLQTAFEVATRALDSYRDRLHGPTPSGRSYADAYDALLDLGDGQQAAIGRALAHVDADRIASTRRLVIELGQVTPAAQPRPGHPWRFACTTTIDQVDRAALAAVIASVGSALPQITQALGPWASALAAAGGLPAARATRAAMALIDSGRLPRSEQWRAIAKPEWPQRVVSAVTAAHGALDALAAVSPDLPSDLLGRDYTATLATVQAASASFAIGRKGRVRSALGDLANLPPFADHHQASAVLTRLSAASVDYRGALGSLASIDGLMAEADGMAFDHGALINLEQRARQVYEVAWAVTAGNEHGSALLQAMNGATVPASGLLNGVDSIIDALTRVFALTRATDDSSAAWLHGRHLLEAASDSIRAWTDAADGLSFVTLRRWSDLNAFVEPLTQEPFAAFREQILAGAVSGEEAPAAFERALMNATLLVVGEDHQFDVFDWMGHDRQITRFVGLLEERQRMLETVIPRILYDTRTFDASATIGVVGQLRTELNAKRRGARSVRDLLSKYPDLILQLTPCFLMSPDSVAKFLEPGKTRFDLVVFDEASQIQVADAVGAMGRATSVVIVGDSKQMPPTSGFGMGGSAGGDQDGFNETPDAVPEDADSILEECVESGLPREMLSWHYRSRDELLIKFSNEHYYDGRLASFPSPVARPDCGLDYRRVDGQFDHGATKTNPIEADAIVAEVRRRVHDPVLGRHTLGVVTLNLPQMALVIEKLRQLNDEAILDLLDSEDPDRELFVLNLESVQGRERDVIILGTSFSKRANGDPMPLFFGPLIQSRGERRLNVAITRARRQVVIFSSFDPEELTRANAVGLVHLREYLELARRATNDNEGLHATASVGAADSHTAEVAEALRARGLIVHEGFGLSSFKVDIAVTTPDQPDRWLVGVLLDGQRWGQRELALDRDALPVTVLRNLMEWPAIARVWLPAWRKDRDEIVSHIHELATVAATGPSGIEPEVPVGEPESTAPADHPDLSEPMDVAAALPAPDAPARPARPGADRGREYREWDNVPYFGTPADLDTSGAIIDRALREVAEVEGPILLDEALRKVARGFCLSRVRESRLEGMRRHAPHALLVTTEFGAFLFPSSLVDGAGGVVPTFDWYRRTWFPDRKIQAIAPHEMANLMVEQVIAAHGVAPDELATAVLAFFGYGRRTAESIAFVRRHVNWAVSHGYLVADGDLMRARIH
jgi:hypothetical protein